MPQERSAREWACRSCQTRKIKCNGERPICSTCIAHGRNCHYEPKPPSDKKRGRPPKSLAPKSSSSPQITKRRTTHNDNSSKDWIFSGMQESKMGNENDSVDVREHLSQDYQGNVVVAGPTNTLYSSPVDPFTPANSVARDARREHLSAHLTATACRQRQLEDLYRASVRGEIFGVKAELALHLLDIHWTRHHFFLLSYRPAFMRDLMNGGGPFFSELFFLTIMYTASRYSHRLEVRTDVQDPLSAGAQFKMRLKELLRDSVETSTIPTAISLLLLGNTEIAKGEVDRGWLYTGIGIRMVLSLGLHIDVEATAHLQKRDPLEVEVCKRLFWGAFISDKLQSLYVGKPIAIHEEDIYVSEDLLDTYEEWDLWKPLEGEGDQSHPLVQPTYSVSTFKNMCKLAVITGRIITKLYSVQSKRQPISQLLNTRSAIREELALWLRELPAQIQYLPWTSNKSEGEMPTHVMILHSLYYSLIILLARPFVSNGHLRNAGFSVAAESWRDCSVAASKIARLIKVYRRAYGLHSAPYQISYVAYVASTIHVRNVAANSDHSQARQYLAVCVDTLREIKGHSVGVSQLEKTVRNLMERMNVNIDENSPGNTHSGILEHSSRTSTLSCSDDMFLPNLSVNLNTIIETFDCSLDTGTPQLASTNYHSAKSTPKPVGHSGRPENGTTYVSEDADSFWLQNAMSSDWLYGCALTQPEDLVSIP